MSLFLQYQQVLLAQQAKAAQVADGTADPSAVEEYLQPINLYNAITFLGSRHKTLDERFVLYATNANVDERITSSAQTFVGLLEAANLKAQAAAQKAHADLREQLTQEMDLKIQAMQTVYDSKLAAMKTTLTAELEKRSLAENTEADIPSLRDSVAKTKKDVLSQLRASVSELEEALQTQKDEADVRVHKLEKDTKAIAARTKEEGMRMDNLYAVVKGISDSLSDCSPREHHRQLAYDVSGPITTYSNRQEELDGARGARGQSPNGSRDPRGGGRRGRDQYAMPPPVGRDHDCFDLTPARLEDRERRQI